MDSWSRNIGIQGCISQSFSVTLGKSFYLLESLLYYLQNKNNNAKYAYPSEVLYTSNEVMNTEILCRSASATAV